MLQKLYLKYAIQHSNEKMHHFIHFRSLATELTTLYRETKPQALVVINGLIVSLLQDILNKFKANPCKY